MGTFVLAVNICISFMIMLQLLGFNSESVYTYIDTEFIGCPLEQDATWNITWPATNISEVTQQKCPGGSEAEGTV